MQRHGLSIDFIKSFVFLSQVSSSHLVQCTVHPQTPKPTQVLAPCSLITQSVWRKGRKKVSKKPVWSMHLKLASMAACTPHCRAKEYKIFPAQASSTLDIGHCSILEQDIHKSRKQRNIESIRILRQLESLIDPALLPPPSVIESSVLFYPPLYREYGTQFCNWSGPLYTVCSWAPEWGHFIPVISGQWDLIEIV